jgi:hypothetical protein
MSQGKGDVRRPQFVDEDEMECNWDLIFRREDKNVEKMKHKKKLRKPPYEQ